MEYRIMAGRTVAVQAFEVIFMAKWNTSDILGFYMQNLLEVGGNSTRKDKQDYHQ